MSQLNGIITVLNKGIGGGSMRSFRALLPAVVIVLLLFVAAPQPLPEPMVNTFSIVAFDPETGDLGVAVESKFPGVGAIVPWAKADVGAIATQSLANLSYGSNGLKLLAMGLSPQQVVDALGSVDPKREERQWGVVDAKGRSANFTGSGCFPWAGGRTGENYAVQGNILVGEETVAAVEKTFLESKGFLGDRLLVALAAGQVAGGDRRGRQSAALLVVRKNGNYDGTSDRMVDLRVYDNPYPIKELQRIYALHKIHFFPTDPKNLITIEGELARELKEFLSASGDYTGTIDETFGADAIEALKNWMYWENYDVRVREDGKIDSEILDIIRAREAEGGTKHQ